jgi:hypothetical protein
MLGSPRYQRNALDFYPTPARTVQSLLDVIEDDLPSYKFWEPFCGNGAFSKPIAGLALESVSTDIRAYEGFDPDGLFDFFAIKPKMIQKTDIPFSDDPEDGKRKPFWKAIGDRSDVVTMADIANLKGFMPDAIITNPPYTAKVEDGVYKTGKNKGKPKFKTIDLAGNAARHAIKLMEHQRGIVIFLCRHEWDAAKARKDLFDHPAFAMKITLRHRPRWIEGSEGAPRFPYAYFVWDWTKPAVSKPELIYAA